MTPRSLGDIPRDVRDQIATAIRECGQRLTDDAAGMLALEPGLDEAGWRSCCQMLVDMLSAAVEDGQVNDRPGGIRELARLSAPPTTRQILTAADRTSCAALDELALHEELGATSARWSLVTHSVRAAMLEVVTAFAERIESAPNVRDRLTTLVARPVFDLVLKQETHRALRHKHGLAMILFDVDDLSALNRTHGYGAGDFVLERLGILARQFFRTHDWVARHGGDSIAVLLPETTLDQASRLADGFCHMVHQRLVLVDDKTEVTATVRLSAAVVAADLVHAEIDPADILSEAGAAATRAKMNGGSRVEQVALLPTSVTIAGAATLLGTTPRDVTRMVRNGALRASRRGRHLHIERKQIDERKGRP